ncbi:toprim domain-containing protein [Rummeliibacillus stabekisii]|uniref:toprim domain-containing protein n=1 Tax=Rummeliibacillus stabekisii TaxID=241244 RepID=UPI003717C6CC
MAVIINNKETEIDVADELEPYLDSFPKFKVRGNKLQSCSPFRDEQKPSFAVNLEDGTWIDSGAPSDDWKKGNLTKLLSFLMGVTFQEVEQYLLEKYSLIYDDVDNYELVVNLTGKQVNKTTYPVSYLEPYAFRNPYLGNRGIIEKVQRAFKIGYDKNNQAITMPWFDRAGNIINIKFRSIKDKRFWYLEEGQPIKQHIYGLHFIYRMQLERVYVVESETDCLYLWSLGIPAIALGSASLSKKQEELLLRSPIKQLVLAFDNDTAGYSCRDNVIKRLMGKVELELLNIPVNCKDVNDVKDKNVLKNTTSIVPRFL